MISPEQFLVNKKIIRSIDLEMQWNLNTSRDTHIHTTKEIVKAMKEYAELYLKENKKC